MRFRRSLRYRVAIAFALFGGLVSLLLAVGLYIASHDLEARLIDESLTAELEDYSARRRRNPQSLPPATATVRGYVLSRGERSMDIPPALLQLSPGRHDLTLDGIPYHVAVADEGGSRFYLLYDQTLLQRRERHFLAFLAAAIGAMVLISAAGGLWLARRTISPVTELAQRVRGLKPEDWPTPLGEDFPQDEVGELARAFDRYLARLRAFIERERAFTADVSHELRTPMAVIQGAAEVLLADDALPHSVRERVLRIERGAREMAELTAALLVMAREEQAGTPSPPLCQVDEVLQEAVEKHRYLLQHKPLEVEVDIRSHPCLPVERPVLCMALGNLIRNAFSYTAGGHIQVRLDADRVIVEDTGAGIRAEDLGRIFERHYRGAASRGAGIGLSLVKRVCDRYGWRVQIESQEGRGTQVQLLFPTLTTPSPSAPLSS
jgi:signal transduction histidine kinase